jgi:hypothetical protein
MSSDKFFLSKEEQYFLMEILELSDVQDAFDRFTEILIEEKCDPQKVDKYIKKILENYKKNKGK